MRDDDRRRIVEICADTDSGISSEWAQRVCALTIKVLPRVDAAALSLRTPQRAEEMLGASDDWAAGLEEQQYTLGEGPGVVAFDSGRAVLVPVLEADEIRWPGFAEAAALSGAGAIFAFPLQLGAIRLGTLDLYRHIPGRLSSVALADASLVADVITASLLRRAEAARDTELERPVSSYQDVNVATGMLAAQLNINLDDAFARLRAHAFTENRSVIDVARDVLARRLQLDQFTD